MTRYAIDAATLVHLVTGGLTADPSHQLVAPNALRTHALDLLLQQVQAGALTEKEALTLHEQMTGIKIRLLGDRVSRRTAWDLARERDWTTLAEAEYLAVAKLQADALVTVEPEMAARADGIVPVDPFSALLTP